MLATALLGGGFGFGVWMLIRAIAPRPVPLGQAFRDLERRSIVVDAHESWTERTLGHSALRFTDALGSRIEDRETDLRLVDRTPTRHALDKLIGTVGGLSVPILVYGGLRVSGIALPAFGIVGLALAAAGFGWFLPDIALRDEADRRRRAFRHALSSYLDLVNVIIAGGGGIETAMHTAAEAGDGWAFASIRQALDRSRLTSRSPWHTFADLATELDVPELAELAASVELAGSHGARIRASLAAKADTLRGHQVAETEAAAESATERMTIPVAVLLFGFLVFIAYPAVQQITTVSGPAGP